MESRRVWLAVAISAAVMVATLCIAPLIGSTSIDFARALAGQSPDKEILFYTRLPRVLLALLAGGSLAVAGVLFQALLRDLSRQGLLVIAVTHDLNLAASFADRIVVLDSGRVAADAAPAEVFTPETVRRVFGLESSIQRGPGGKPWIVYGE